MTSTGLQGMPRREVVRALRVHCSQLGGRFVLDAHNVGLLQVFLGSAGMYIWSGFK